MYRLLVIFVVLGAGISCTKSSVIAPSPLAPTAAPSASIPSSRQGPAEAGRSADNLLLLPTSPTEEMAAAPPFNGNYAGNWNGKIGKETWNQPLTFQVRGTVITVTRPLRLRGTVSPGGLVSILKGADPAIPTLQCTVKGLVRTNKGKRSGLGTWSCQDTQLRNLKGVGKWTAEVP